MSISLLRKAPRFWERRGPTSLLLWPLSFLYGCILRLCKLLFDLGIARANRAPVPIIIVGNIRVGGTGKTPIVIALAQRLSQLGWKPAIISRGYSASIHDAPMRVKSDSNPAMVGDEPVLIAKRTHNEFPIWVFPKRNKSIKTLLKDSPEINVIISDDGLQHKSMARWPAREGGRDIELVVRDQRGEGNRFLLPAGPLREPAWRERDATLQTQDASHTKNGFKSEYIQGRRAFTLSSHLGAPYQLMHPDHSQTFEQIAKQHLPKNIAMVAGLGNPQRFFDDLHKLGISGKKIPLPDHASYTTAFFQSIPAQCILMTEKDAVKCADIHDGRIWVVPLTLHLPETFIDWVHSILQRPDPYRYNL